MAKDTAIGIRLREVRNGLGLTQDEFAKRLGLSRLSIARYEGGRIPKLSVLRQIARAGNTTIASLLGPDTDPNRPGKENSVPPAVSRLLRRLRAQLEAGANIERSVDRRQYEQRSKVVLSRAIRDLEDYREMFRDRPKRG